MNIDQMIELLTEIREEHGVLEIFDSECFSVDDLIVTTNEDCREEDNMPELFVQLPYMS